MNISSIIIQTVPGKQQDVIRAIKNGDFCEYHLHDDKGRIIVTVEAQGVEEEIGKVRQIEQIDGVLAANMHFLYSEDELDNERDKLEKTNELPGWLNNPNATAKDIRYNGDLKGRF